MAAMRSGCSEYLVKPFQPERISHALAHVAARPQGKSGDLVKGRIITVMGAKGGTGRYLAGAASGTEPGAETSAESACWWMNIPRSVMPRLYLGLGRHQYSFYELVHNTDRLDADLLRGFSAAALQWTGRAGFSRGHRCVSASFAGSHRAYAVVSRGKLSVRHYRLSSRADRGDLCCHPAIGPSGHRHYSGTASDPQRDSLDRVS